MSKLLMFDFLCVCGCVHEAMVPPEKREHECPDCGKAATRLIPAVRPQLEGFTGDFPTAADAWVKRREQRMAQERKHERDHGTTWIGKSGDDFPK